MRFAQIIRSEPAVRNCFQGVPTHSWWWKVVLGLHGKPCGDELSEFDRRRILSRGFRFYAVIYLIVSVGLLASTMMSFVLEIVDWGFWCGMFGMAGTFVLASSLLGFHAAQLYPRDTSQGSALLLAFFVSMVGFLMFLSGAVSVVAYEYQLAPGFLIFPVMSVFVLIGVGSYLFEIIYLIFTCESKCD